MRVYVLAHTPNAEAVIVACARTSRGRPPWQAGLPVPKEAQASLRRMLADGHFSVLEFAHLTLGFEGFSRACLDQMRTHRHLSFLAESTRHADFAARGLFRPPGLEGEPEAEAALARVEEACREAYRALVGHGRDLARYVLPLGVTCRWVVAGNLRAWREFCEKRLRPEAHAEIRALAAAVVAVGAAVAPVAFEALVPAAEAARKQGWEAEVVWAPLGG